MAKKYDVWIILEEREGKDNTTPIETCYIGTCNDEDSGRQLFDAVQTVGMAIQDIPQIKIQQDF